MIHKNLIPLSMLILAMMLAACNFSGSQPTATLSNNAIQTQVAGTIIAQRTQQAGQQAVDLLTEIAKTAGPATVTATTGQPTESGRPTSTPVPPTVTAVPPTATPVPPSATTTQTPTATPLPPTATPLPPTATPIPPSPTPVPTPCNWAKFVADISVPDGTAFIAGSSFTKTWRIQNIGTCRWTREYAVVYESGDRMGALKVNWLDNAVLPGETVDLSIAFTAPSANGKYTGYWKLRDQNGASFGIGKGANDAFWVQIKVTEPTQVAYDFGSHLCDAEWSTKDGPVPCSSDEGMGRDLHGTDSDEISSRSGMNIAVDSGSVEWVANPKLENNTVENEAAIVVFPNDGSDGYISGKYPKRSIQAGDWFRAVIGCMYDSPQCNVTFKLDYQVDGDSVKNLGKWTQTYDGKIQHIDVDLSFLAGKNVVFILTVQNNGSNLDDNAFWLLPRIAR